MKFTNPQNVVSRLIPNAISYSVPRIYLILCTSTVRVIIYQNYKGFDKVKKKKSQVLILGVENKNSPPYSQKSLKNIQSSKFLKS